MKLSRIIRKSQGGFSLIEIIISIVVSAIVGMMFLSYMGTSLNRSGDPINIARNEGMEERWMECIESDFVKEMNAATYTTALVTIQARDYTASACNIPAGALTRTWVTYDTVNSKFITSAGTSTNLEVVIQYGASSAMTMILTAERTSNGDSTTYY